MPNPLVHLLHKFGCLTNKLFALRNAFVQQAMTMNPAEEQKYWQDQKMKKGINPPSELSDTVRAVSSSPGAISYCYRKDFNPAMAKILLTL